MRILALTLLGAPPRPLNLHQMRVLRRTRVREVKLAHFAVSIRSLRQGVRDAGPVLGDEVRNGAVRDEHDVCVRSG